MGEVVHTSSMVITREKGPGAMSVRGAIAIEDSAEIAEPEDVR